MDNVKKYAAIGGLVALAACWPLAVGQFAHNTFQDGIAQIQQDEVQVQLVQYHRGYLSSSAQTKVTIINPILKQRFEMDGLPTEFVLDHDIRHGLLSVSTDSKLQNYQQLPIDVHSVTYVNGATELTAVSQKMTFNFANDVNSKLEFAPAKLSAHFSTSHELTFDYQLEGFNGRFSNGESIILSSLNGSGSGEKKQGFWLGTQQLKLGELNLIDALGESMVNIHQFDYQFNTQEDAKENTFSSHHQVAVDSVDFSDETLTDLGFEASFKHLDTKAFSDLLTVYQTNEHQLTAEDIQRATTSVDTLFSKGFSVSVDEMKASIDDGKFSSQLTLNFPQSDKPVSQNPLQILSSMEGGANAFISNEMVKRYPFMQPGLDDMIQQGMMDQQADGYHINGKITGGNIQFSGGKSLPLIAFIAPLLFR